MTIEVRPLVPDKKVVRKVPGLGYEQLHTTDARTFTGRTVTLDTALGSRTSGEEVKVEAGGLDEGGIVNGEKVEVGETLELNGMVFEGS